VQCYLVKEFVRKLKRIAIVCLIICAVILASAANMPNAHASIASYNWIGAIARNSPDAFYGVLITAYGENTTANLVVNVYNDRHFPDQINVSAVKVGFDWGQNYTSVECNITNPFVMPYGQSHVFSVTFTVPSVLLANNFVTHGYTIYVEQANSTSGNVQIISPTWTESGDGFAVFSSDQADAYNFKKQIAAYPTTTSINGFPILTAQARELIVQSNVAKTLADNDYMQGDFSGAKKYYGDSLNDIQGAFSNDTQQWSTIENALTNLIQGGAGLLMFQGYAWLFFGIGFLLMSIGVLVYLTRKRPKPSA
jgi:hypothetical protein